MLAFIELQYRMGRLTAQQVWAFAPKWLTQEQAEELTGA